MNYVLIIGYYISMLFFNPADASGLSQNKNVNPQVLQNRSSVENHETLVLKTEQHKRWNYLYAGTTVIAFLGLGLMHRNYQWKLKIAKDREQELEEKLLELDKSKTEHQILEYVSMDQLKESQTQLLDKNKQLHKEVLANQLILEQKNNILLRIKSNLKVGHEQQVLSLLKEDALIQGNFELIKDQIQFLHPDFFHHLQIRSAQKLTNLDYKYCAFLYLKLSSWQIAQVLHVEVSSVRMFKYRLKQKLQLPKTVSLENFLQQLEGLN